MTCSKTRLQLLRRNLLLLRCQFVNVNEHGYATTPEVKEQVQQGEFLECQHHKGNDSFFIEEGTTVTGTHYAALWDLLRTEL